MLSKLRKTNAERRRHRKSARSVKGNSDARINADPRKLITIPEKWTKYSGSFLKYIVRHNNGVGRPTLERRKQVFIQQGVF